MTIRRGLKAIEGGGEGDPRLGPLCARAVHLLGGWCHSNAPFIVSCICFMTVTDDTNVRDLSSSAHVFCLHICRQIFFLSFPLSFSTSFFLSFLLAFLLSFLFPLSGLFTRDNRTSYSFELVASYFVFQLDFHSTFATAITVERLLFL